MVKPTTTKKEKNYIRVNPFFSHQTPEKEREVTQSCPTICDPHGRL